MSTSSSRLSLYSIFFVFFFFSNCFATPLVIQPTDIPEAAWSCCTTHACTLPVYLSLLHWSRAIGSWRLRHGSDAHWSRAPFLERTPFDCLHHQHHCSSTSEADPFFEHFSDAFCRFCDPPTVWDCSATCCKVHNNGLT